MKHLKTFELYKGGYLDRRAMSNRKPEFLTYIKDP